MSSLGVVIQARMGSSRMPGKVLEDFCGKPMLLFQLDILKRMKLDAEIVVATTIESNDNAIVGLCRANGTLHFCGSEKNVFERYSLAGEKFGFEHIIRHTSDNPLPHKQVILACLDRHLESKADLTSVREILADRTQKRYVPAGCSVDVINCKTLHSIDPRSLDEFQKEHVIPVFYEREFHVEVVQKISQFSAPEFSLSVDTNEDMARVSQYAQHLIDEGRIWEQLGIEY